MSQKSFWGKVAVTMTVAAATLVAIGGPASAYESWSRSITCTSSSGYSTHITSDTKGSAQHMVGSFSRTYQSTTWSQRRHSNTGIGGSNQAWVFAWDSGSTSGSIQYHSAYCGTY